MPAPVFLLAPPRSFTTVVTAMLGNHSALFGLAEINLFARDDIAGLSRLWQRTPRLSHGLLRSIAELGFGGQEPADIDAVRAWLDANGDMLTAEIFDGLRDWAGERALLDKSPLHVTSPEHLRRIGAAVPDARFIHMTRHPLAVWRSALDLRGRIQRSGMTNTIVRELTPEIAWLKPQVTILEFLHTIPPERQLRVKGETLMTEPARYLPQICDWLGLETTEADLDAMLHPERSPFARMGPQNAPFGNDPSFMQKPELRPFKDTMPPVEAVTEAEHGVTFEGDILHHAQLFGY